MTFNEHIKDYIFSLEPDIPEQLARLEAKALADNVPIIRRESQSVLRFLLKTRKPMKILEVGTAVGFSTLFMHEYMPEGASVTTLEKVEMRLKEARKNLSGYNDIRLLEGDAALTLQQLLEEEGESVYDFVFLDAAKGQYSLFKTYIEKLMKPGAMLVTDNVLLDGTIGESRYAIERRDRTIHTRMREYLYDLTHSEVFDTIIIPSGDGMSVSVKKEHNEET